MKLSNVWILPVLALALAAAAAAAPPPPKTPTVPPPPSAGKPGAHPKWGKLKGGTVSSVSAAAGTVTVQAADKTVSTLTVSKKSRIHRNRKQASLADIAVGDHVLLVRFNNASKEVVQLDVFAVGK